jgi:hypothetical protein
LLLTSAGQAPAAAPELPMQLRGSPPTVIMLGGRSRRELAVLHDLGARIVYLDERTPVQLIPWVDVPLDADLTDGEAVLALVREVCGPAGPAGVLTHTEPRIALMAFLADRLGLAGRTLSRQAAENCRDKLRTRQVLTSSGVRCPAARPAMTPAQAGAVAGEIGFPVVVKPRSGAGGSGVRMCADARQSRSAAARIFRADPLAACSGVIVEEYVPGAEYAVQTLTVGGVTEILTVFAQQMTAPPVFVELGYDYPPGLSAGQYRELSRVVTAALDAVGLDNWISHTQVRQGASGFTVIEVNARRPGGRLAEMTDAVCGVDMVRAASELSLGMPVSRHQPRAAVASYRSIVVTETGALLYRARPDLSRLSSAVPPIIELDIRPGEPVLPADHPDGGVYGRIVVFGDCAEVVEHDLAIIGDAVGIEVTTLPQLGAATDSREFKSCC